MPLELNLSDFHRYDVTAIGVLIYTKFKSNQTLLCDRKIPLGEKLTNLIIDHKVVRNFVAKCVVDKLNLHVESHNILYKSALKSN